ncbi:interferon-induced protein with tetratricopeptide repeats 2-like [Embiotoca jacksoni]|uniref:interferon-induced protein with tetratricopeptide repeats 2-like n=1 Tax=Embiotoca jacksoni TaxID=100190 RepID=UPI00370488D6
MSAAQSPSPTLKSRLEALQCHFTWDLSASKSALLRFRDGLKDIGTEEGYSWRGHIYNLQGFIHHQLVSVHRQPGSVEEARSFFGNSTEAFRQVRNTVTDEGPWLVVNYGNLAWLHHHLGEWAESEGYLSKIDTLMREYTSPSRDELHAEVCAEKAWTLKCLGRRPEAVDYFQRAIRMQPGMVEWQTSRVLALPNDGSDANILKEMRVAIQNDPENLYLAAVYLEACGPVEGDIGSKARELATRVLRKPVSSYSGIVPLLRVYRKCLSLDEAIDLAEQALDKHPDERYLKRCAARCYKWRIYSQKDNPLKHIMIDKAIRLFEDVISCYPDSSLDMKIDLASIYQELNNQAKADQIFEGLLGSNLDDDEKQMLYKRYAAYLKFCKNEQNKSIDYLMKAAAIKGKSVHRDYSIKTLKRIRDGRRSQRCAEIEEFLFNLE